MQKIISRNNGGSDDSFYYRKLWIPGICTGYIGGKAIYDQVADEVSDSIVEETPVLSENNVIVAKLTEAEANELSEGNDVWIEEDILLFGSTADEEAEAARAARAAKKAEKIRRAQEYLAMEDEEDTEAEPEYEWNLQAVNADTAVAEEGASYEDPSDTNEQNQQMVKVAVLDSGVDMVSGIDLSGSVNLVEEEQYLAEMFLDMTGHGTGVAGVIAGNGESGIYGINPNAQLYSVKVLDRENKAPLSRIIHGIYWCIENSINIINMSFGTPVYSRALEQAVADAYAANILMVAAAGNDGEGVEYPAAFDEVMAVAATDTQAQISEFSNTGEELEIAAPGEKIRVAGFFDGSQITHGTSIAVPHVTGAASLLWEKDLTKSNDFIRELLAQSAKDIEGTDECGLLDVEYALASYDAFAANYSEADKSQTVIPENSEEPQSFEDVDTDEAYVEGRWKAGGGSVPGHKAMVDKMSDEFSTAVLDIIKQGIVYPDSKESGWKEKHPWWHGKWDFNENGTKVDINYVAVFDLVTTIAVNGGSFSGWDYDAFWGINKTVYNKVKANITGLDFNKFSFANTKANRKYFLYGCGMHTMTDAFAHSTTTKAGILIDHKDSVKNADNAAHFPRRYTTAERAVKYSMEELAADTWSDGAQILQALKDIYIEGTDFKMIRIKPYVNANGYSGAVLTTANIDNPK